MGSLRDGPRHSAPVAAGATEHVPVAVPLRDTWGMPLHVSSGYRPAAETPPLVAPEQLVTAGAHRVARRGRTDE
jgi:hypothetical protein